MLDHVEIYGHSDDCIELEGTIADEFSAWNKWQYLHFADGTIVKVGYDKVPDKGWHIEVVREHAKVTVGKPTHQDGEHYTDRLSLDGEGLAPVECWSSEDGPTDSDMEIFWDNFDQNAYSLSQLTAAHRALKTQ